MDKELNAWIIKKLDMIYTYELTIEDLRGIAQYLKIQIGADSIRTVVENFPWTDKYSCCVYFEPETLGLYHYIICKIGYRDGQRT